MTHRHLPAPSAVGRSLSGTIPGPTSRCSTSRWPASWASRSTVRRSRC
ncbi:MAG: hypothetical protein MZV64_52615 [Ignavibacteriales bacterium]|nr:hypothetical protein [Ignavibacteriales bacterium]